MGITENRNDTRWWVVTGRRNHRHGRWMEGARAYKNVVEKLTGGTLEDGMRMRSVEMTAVTA